MTSNYSLLIFLRTHLKTQAIAMKTKILIFVLCLFSLTAHSNPSDFLTDDYLINDDYTDHIENFKRLMGPIHIHSFLEFGLGYGTKFFLDHCDEVTSLEFVLPDPSIEPCDRCARLYESDRWYNQCLQLFEEYANWHPLLCLSSPFIQEADIISHQKSQDPALIDASYLLELKYLCDELFSKKTYEMAFVDPGIHMRGDLVNELFGRVPIIVAHDTNCANEKYGWSKIQTPCNYEKIHFSNGMGTTFWVSQEKKEVIRALKNGPPSPLSTQKLRIFFPNIHPALTTSMGLALKHLGHTLVLPGGSFAPSKVKSKFKLSYGDLSPREFIAAHPYLAKHIEIIEKDDLFKRPPDVLFINAREVEEDLLAIFKKLQKSAKTKLAYYSGNNCTAYSKEFLKNLLVADACTEHLFKNDNANIAHWIPWIDYDRLPFAGTNDQPLIYSYLALHYRYPAFKQGAEIYQRFSEEFRAHYPNVSFVNHEKLSPKGVSLALEESAATLHIKDTEGFGYTIVESLAQGRPVFLKRSFSQGSRLMNWCIEGKTALFFDSYEEFRDKMERFLFDTAYRHQLQEESAKTIRCLVDNEKQARALEHFLQTLR